MKKDKNKLLIKYWRPISLFNVDTKLVSKVSVKRLKTALPLLIPSYQMAYLNSRFISEGERLISDIYEVINLLKLKEFLLTVNIEKAIDSANHNFLFKVLENSGFNQDWINWISIWFQNQESSVIDGGKTTRYLPLKRDVWQGVLRATFFFRWRISGKLLLNKINIYRFC